MYSEQHLCAACLGWSRPLPRICLSQTVIEYIVSELSSANVLISRASLHDSAEDCIPSVDTYLRHNVAAQWKNVVIWLEFWWFFHFSLLTVWQSQIISWNPVGKRVLSIWPNLILSSRWHTCASQRMFMFDLCVNWISWGFEMSKIVFFCFFLTLYKL